MKNHRPASHRQIVAGLETARRAWTLVVDRGLSQADAAAELGLTQGAVSRALRRAEAVVRADLAADIVKHKATMLARYEQNYREADAAWRASKTGSISKTSRQTDGRRMTQIVTVERPGDAIYLKRAEQALAGIRKLLGLDAPQQVAIVNPDRPLEDLTDDELHAELSDAMRQAGYTATKIH